MIVSLAPKDPYALKPRIVTVAGKPVGFVDVDGATVQIRDLAMAISLAAAFAEVTVKLSAAVGDES
mgnify:CR=1 FL=1